MKWWLGHYREPLTPAYTSAQCPLISVNTFRHPTSKIEKQGKTRRWYPPNALTLLVSSWFLHKKSGKLVVKHPGNITIKPPRLIHQPIIKSQQMTTTLFVVQQQVCHVAIAQNQGLSPRKAHRSWFVVGKTTSCLPFPSLNNHFYRWYVSIIPSHGCHYQPSKFQDICIHHSHAGVSVSNLRGAGNKEPGSIRTDSEVLSFSWKSHMPRNELKSSFFSWFSAISKPIGLPEKKMALLTHALLIQSGVEENPPSNSSIGHLVGV